MNNGISKTIVSVVGSITFLLANSSLALTTSIVSLGNSQSIERQLVNSAPYSSNRVKRNSKKMSVLKDRTRVRLKVKFNRGLGIANSDVKWTVRPVDGKGTQLKRGREATIRLKPGKYVVSLKIGDYSKTQTVTVKRSRNSVQTIPVTAKLGIVKASSNFKNVSSSDVKWTVKTSNGKIISKGAGSNLKKIVPAGNYNVVANYNGNAKGRNVTVSNGGIGKTTIEMPTGTVKFQAFKGKGKKEPLMEKATWMVYDSNGKVVASSKKNNFRVTLFQGSYSVVVKVLNNKTKRSFNVRAGRNADVFIHM